MIGWRSGYIVLANYLLMRHKMLHVLRANVSAMNLWQNSQYLWNIFFSRSIWVLLKLVHRWTQHFTKIDKEKHKIEQICIWDPITTGFIMQTLIYVISMEFLPLGCRRSSLWNILSNKEQGKQLFYYLSLSSLN